MKIFNLSSDDWDRIEDREGWKRKDAWVGGHIASGVRSAGFGHEPLAITPDSRGIAR